MAEVFSNNAQTTLNGAINNSTTSITLTSAAAFPPSGTFRIKIDDELMIVTGVSSNTLTVERGAENTSAASHDNGATVSHIVTAEALGKFVQSPGDATVNEIAIYNDTTATTLTQSGLKIVGDVVSRIDTDEPVQIGYGLTVGTSNVINPSCDDSFVCGVGGKAISPGEHIIAGRSSFDGNAGSSQVMTYILNAVTVDTSTVEMFLDTTTTVTGSGRMVIPPNHAWCFDAVVHSTTRFHHYKGVAYNYGGTLFLPFGQPVLISSYGLSEGSDSLTFAVDSSDDTLRINVTTINGTQYWQAKVTVSQVALYVSGGGS